MQWHDEVFVELAYLIIIGRPADTIGRQYYLKRIREGRGRLAILDQLAKAAEAKPLWAQISDLQAALDRYRASRRFFAGLRLRRTDPELGMRPPLARARAITNEIGRARQDIMLACGELIAGHKDLLQLVSTQGAAHMGGTSAIAQESKAAVDLHTPRLRSPSDVRENDFDSSEKRLMQALRI
jgi:multidrug resistance efflux pump